MSSRSVASLGVLAALVAALGFLLAGVPNVELMTLSAFVSGALLGTLRGGVVGGTAMGIYSLLNPYGAAPPPTFATQVAGCAGVGMAGGLMASRLLPVRGGRAAGAVAGGVIGFTLTLAYDLLTNLGTAWSTGMDVGPTLLGGVGFGLGHMVANAIFFALAGPPLLAALRRRAAGAV